MFGVSFPGTEAFCLVKVPGTEEWDQAAAEANQAAFEVFTSPEKLDRSFDPWLSKLLTFGAVLIGSPNLLEYCIWSRGNLLGSDDGRKFTILHVAVIQERFEIVRYLLGSVLHDRAMDRLDLETGQRLNLSFHTELEFFGRLANCGIIHRYDLADF